MPAKLTKAEKAWLQKLQSVLDECPSDRIGFYTIGDPDVSIYNKHKDPQIDKIMSDPLSTADFTTAVDRANARFDGPIISLDFPSHVHSTAG